MELNTRPAVGRPKQRSVEFLKLRAVQITCVALCFLFSGCAEFLHPKETAPAETEKPSGDSVTLIGLNDLQGQLFATPASDETHVSAETPEAGGAARLARGIAILKREAPGPTLVFDAGNSLSGSYESAWDQGREVVKLYDSWEVRASLLGATDLNLPSAQLSARAQESHYAWIASNVHPAPAFTVPTGIYQAGKIKVGVFGLVSRHTPLLLSPSARSKYEIQELTETAQKDIQSLRQAGAQVIVLLSRLSVSCMAPAPIANLNARHASNSTWTPQTPQMPCYSFSELAQLIHALGDTGIDAVISGGSHEIIHGFIEDVPVVQGGLGGLAPHSITLYYDATENRVRRSFSRIDGPVPVCSAVFSHQGDCDAERLVPKNGRGHLSKAAFHGWPIDEDSAVEHELRALHEQVEKEGGKKITSLSRTLTHSSARDSDASRWLAETLLHHSENADFAIVQTGALRKSISAGELTNAQLFEALPVDFKPAELQLTGSEIKKLVQILTAGTRGFPGIAGLHVKIIDPKYPALPPNHSGGRKTLPWEIDRVLAIRDSKGFKLKDGKRYTVITTDFIAGGGDDTESLMKQLSPKHVEILQQASVRQWASESLAKSPPLDTPSSLAFGLPAARVASNHSRKRKTATR